LDHAHACGALHRDVKPHNVLIDGEHQAWLADFGLTRLLEDSSGLTGTGGLVGTFDYLAPEIARGESASVRSDVYGLAVTAFQTITGQLPFPSTSHAEAVLAHVSASRPRASALLPELPAELDEALRRGMSVDPLARQRSAGCLLDDLRGALTLKPIEHPGAAFNSAEPDARAASSVGTISTPLVTTPGPPLPARAPSAPTHQGWGRLVRTVPAVLGLVAAVALAVLLTRHDSPSPRRRPAAGAHAAKSLSQRPLRDGTYNETTGGLAHAWGDYTNAGGTQAPAIPSNATVKISCRVPGFRVSDGNVWWYRIASRPWDDHYYASADAFYNNGHTTGTLLRTPFYDPKVPTC
jgi:hypothetical protein